MPVWHDATKDAVKAGKLVLLGVAQEQHPERCQLFAQWKQFDWPIVHDPINVFEVSAVPITIAIDEHGIVRSTRPQFGSFKADFLDKTFADDAKVTPPRIGPKYPPDFDALRTANTWLELGDALTLWGGEVKLNDAIAAYTKATELAPKDGRAFFRLGVCQRRRYESAARAPTDFALAVGNWGQALELDPNQYIWRRRIQQYGPRLDKPYPFYNWVEEAEAAIRARGEKPVELKVRPGGAELAAPQKTFPAAREAKNPDPDGKVNRDASGSVSAEVVVVPARVKPGQTARVHVTLRVDATKGKWNNEAEPLRLWVNTPDAWRVSEQLLEAKAPAKEVSDEPRTLDFEVQVPVGATGRTKLPAFAVYHVCDAAGVCRFVRLDIAIEVEVAK